ncbi:MAG: leucyl-tRNA synthetase, partial [Bacteroidia bacterium]
ALHPFTQKKLPIYISEYVLSGYGTGAIMAVPAHDERDHAFATKFGIDIIQVVGSKEEINIQAESYDAKYGKLMNSENFDRLSVKEGAAAIIQLAEERGFGTRKVNFKLRDAGYSRQRYWGEPFPIIHQDGIPTVISELPVKLPPVDSYEAKGTGESPLANNKEWVNTPTGRRETDTMPGYAGSSWYFLRYMDPHNDQEFAGKESLAYWNQVDLYIGGTEHATGHLLYSRFWTKFLCDRGHIQFDEPFKKLVNQGMIQGESMLLESEGRELHVPVNIASKEATLDSAQFAQLQKLDNRFETIHFSSIATDGKIKLRTQVEKMSKSKFNVVNPDDISDQYGADTLRLYEMFLGPLEDSKPWSTKGIDGTYRFLKKLWALFFDQDGNTLWADKEASKDSMKTLHATIKKITEDIDNMSLNTSVAQFMICVNELGSQKCTSKSVLEQVLVLLNPFAPHITEELWNAIGNEGFIADATWPTFDEKHLIESSKIYPISINGKTRTNLEFPLDMSKEEIEKNVLADEIVQKWLDGKPPKKVIVVPGRIVNVVM